MDSSDMPFHAWIKTRCCTTQDCVVNDVSADLPKTLVNKLFETEFLKAYERVVGDSLGMRTDGKGDTFITLTRPLSLLLTWKHFSSGFDWTGYLAAALCRNGVSVCDLDGMVAKAVDYLLVEPGKLFSGWTGASSLPARLRREIAKAVCIINKRDNRDLAGGRKLPRLSPQVVQSRAHDL